MCDYLMWVPGNHHLESSNLSPGLIMVNIMVKILEILYDMVKCLNPMNLFYPDIPCSYRCPVCEKELKDWDGQTCEPHICKHCGWPECWHK